MVRCGAGGEMCSLLRLWCFVTGRKNNNAAVNVNLLYLQFNDAVLERGRWMAASWSLLLESMSGECASREWGFFFWVVQVGVGKA